MDGDFILSYKNIELEWLCNGKPVGDPPSGLYLGLSQNESAHYEKFIHGVAINEPPGAVRAFIPKGNWTVIDERTRSNAHQIKIPAVDGDYVAKAWFLSHDAILPDMRYLVAAGRLPYELTIPSGRTATIEAGALILRK